MEKPEQYKNRNVPALISGVSFPLFSLIFHIIYIFCYFFAVVITFIVDRIRS